MQLNLVEVSFHLKMCRKLGALLADRNAEFKNTFCNDHGHSATSRYMTE